MTKNPIRVDAAFMYTETFEVTEDEIETYRRDLWNQGSTWEANLSNEDVVKQIATSKMDKAVAEYLLPSKLEVIIA